MTAIDGVPDLKHFDREFAATNRLRTEGTDHLLAAARATGVRRVVRRASPAGRTQRTGGPIKTEDDPLDTNPPVQQRETLAAIRHLERAARAAPLEAVVLQVRRTSTDLGVAEALFDVVRARKFPDRRRRRRRLVVDPPRRRRRCHGCRARPRQRRLQHRRRRPGRRCATCCPRSPRHRCEAAAPGTGLAGAPARRRGRRLDADADARVVERQGQARARLGAALAELARGHARTRSTAGSARHDRARSTELRP